MTKQCRLLFIAVLAIFAASGALNSLEAGFIGAGGFLLRAIPAVGVVILATLRIRKLAAND